MTGAASGGGRRRNVATAGAPGAGADSGGSAGPRAGRTRDTGATAPHREPPHPQHAVADTVVVYTDGACKGNPGPGGWGALLRHGVHERELFGGEVSTTNNRMELLAVIRALEALKRPCRVEVYTDSRYVQQGIRDWIHNWKKNGWRTADRKPVKNAELWQELDRVASRHSVEWRWVKGHADNPGNVRADALANKGAQGAGARAPGRED